MTGSAASVIMALSTFLVPKSMFHLNKMHGTSLNLVLIANMLKHSKYKFHTSPSGAQGCQYSHALNTIA